MMLLFTMKSNYNTDTDVSIVDIQEKTHIIIK